MKKNTLEKIRTALLKEHPEIILEDNLISLAKKPLEKMLALSDS
jgi:quinolinate synthase